MEVLLLIDELEDIIDNAGSIPFSNKVMVDGNELLELIKEIRIKLPDDIKQAQWITEERDRIIEEAQTQASQTVEKAQVQFEEMLNNDEIVREARVRAEDIMNKASVEGNQIREGSLDYADGLLEQTQVKLSDLIKLINENRKQLRG
ncbi:MAG: ATPase [Tissierellia bacterium]|nr:ATPase [Tissierellia bacterium]